MSGFIFYVEILLAAYVALVLGLYVISLRIPQAAFAARLLASYASLLIASGYGVIVGICFRLVGFHRSGQWATARCFKWAMQLSTGVKFKVEDPHNYLNTIRPAVFVGNHQTELDVLMLATIFPKYCSVAAKSSLKKVPVLGWFMSLSGTVFINRADPKDARAAMAEAAKEVASKRQSVYMFPEGTRSYSNEPMLLPFKKGAFHLAVQAGVPIVPVVVANYSDVLYVKDWKFRSGVILVKGELKCYL
jgi:lysophosphatidate acyltransferase